MGKLSLIVENNKIKECRVEELRLSDKIGNDKEVAAILPACFSDGDCRKKGFIGTCQDAGKHSSRCLYSETSRIKLSVIVPRPCIVCDTSKIVDFLEKQFPGLVVSYLYYPGAKAQKLVKDLGIRGLPVYLLDKDIEKEAGFSALRKNLEAKGGFYMLKPQATGISHFVERDRIRGKLDLFISLFDKRSAELLGVIKEFRPSVHFLAVERLETFDAAGGNLEVEECLRSVCVQKYYPGLFWGYISCRAKNKDSSWWEDCLGAADASRIKTCARGPEGKALLRENTKLTRELQIMFGPVYLVDNQEIFSSENVPSREEFKKIFK